MEVSLQQRKLATMGTTVWVIGFWITLAYCVSHRQIGERKASTRLWILEKYSHP